MRIVQWTLRKMVNQQIGRIFFFAWLITVVEGTLVTYVTSGNSHDEGREISQRSGQSDTLHRC
jgi:hypothetical protein